MKVWVAQKKEVVREGETKAGGAVSGWNTGVTISFMSPSAQRPERFSLDPLGPFALSLRE